MAEKQFQIKPYHSSNINSDDTTIIQYESSDDLVINSDAFRLVNRSPSLCSLESKGELTLTGSDAVLAECDLYYDGQFIQTIKWGESNVITISMRSVSNPEKLISLDHSLDSNSNDEPKLLVKLKLGIHNEKYIDKNNIKAYIVCDQWERCCEGSDWKLDQDGDLFYVVVKIDTELIGRSFTVSYRSKDYYFYRSSSHEGQIGKGVNEVSNTIGEDKEVFSKSAKFKNIKLIIILFVSICIGVYVTMFDDVAGVDSKSPQAVAVAGLIDKILTDTTLVGSVANFGLTQKSGTDRPQVESDSNTDQLQSQSDSYRAILADVDNNITSGEIVEIKKWLSTNSDILYQRNIDTNSISKSLNYYDAMVERYKYNYAQFASDLFKFKHIAEIKKWSDSTLYTAAYNLESSNKLRERIEVYSALADAFKASGAADKKAKLKELNTIYLSDNHKEFISEFFKYPSEDDKDNVATLWLEERQFLGMKDIVFAATNIKNGDEPYY